VRQGLTLSAQCLQAIPQSFQFVFCTSGWIASPLPSFVRCGTLELDCQFCILCMQAYGFLPIKWCSIVTFFEIPSQKALFMWTHVRKIFIARTNLPLGTFSSSKVFLHLIVVGFLQAIWLWMVSAFTDIFLFVKSKCLCVCVHVSGICKCT